MAKSELTKLEEKEAKGELSAEEVTRLEELRAEAENADKVEDTKTEEVEESEAPATDAGNVVRDENGNDLYDPTREDGGNQTR